MGFLCNFARVQNSDLLHVVKLISYLLRMREQCMRCLVAKRHVSLPISFSLGVYVRVLRLLSKRHYRITIFYLNDFDLIDIFLLRVSPKDDEIK